jgi:prophage maintenance system killer protein
MIQASDILLYEASDGTPQIAVHLIADTVWLSQAQMCVLFDVQKAAISKHLKNIFSSKELMREATVSIFETVDSEGGRQVRRKIEHYNLDAIISVGYRVNSKRAVVFRQWATRTLREHLVNGFTLNKERLANNARELEAALELVRKVAYTPELTTDMGRGLVDVVTRYMQTFLLLQRYDEGLLTTPAEQAGGVLLTLSEARIALTTLKADLLKRGEATDLFARDRGDGLAALLGNLNQSVFGTPAYPSVESKAAHLLYFVIKNHPFADGNKRSAAFLFVDFLYRNQRLLMADGVPVINDTGLAALTLLIAESKPEQKEILIKLVMNMLVLHELS